MPSGKHKTKRFRKVFRKTPGNKTVIAYTQKSPKNAKCKDCGIILKGVPRLLAAKAKNTPKTKKRPQRAFGGVLCSKCSRKTIKVAARV